MLQQRVTVKTANCIGKCKPVCLCFYISLFMFGFNFRANWIELNRTALLEHTFRRTNQTHRLHTHTHAHTRIHTAAVSAERVNWESHLTSWWIYGWVLRPIDAAPFYITLHILVRCLANFVSKNNSAFGIKQNSQSHWLMIMIIKWCWNVNSFS